MEDMRQRLTRGDIWQRALCMVIFAIAYGIAEMVITFLVIFQFLTILFTGHANEPLLKFGNNLSTYVYQILRFQTFNTETQPFPFSTWPDEEATGKRWIEDKIPSQTQQDLDDKIAAPEMEQSSDDEPPVEPDGDPADTAKP